MKNISITLFAILFTFHAYSQTCYEENLVILNEEDIEDFVTFYPDCTHILGDLRVYGDDIYNLSQLAQIERVDGRIKIWGADNLTSIYGLHNIESVGRDVKIGSNDQLVSLSMPSLLFVEEDIKIIGNPVLSDLSGLNSLLVVGGNLNITNCASLEDIVLPNLILINNDFIISENESLSNISGLYNLEQVGGILRISSIGDIIFDDLTCSVDNLVVLGPITSLQGADITVNSHLGIGNTFLTSFDGINVSDALKTLNVSYNSLLEELTGLEQVTSLEEFWIQNNPILVDFGLDQLEHIGYLYLQGNASMVEIVGLENVVEVELNIMIINNNALHSMDGLSGLNDFEGLLCLQYNDNLDNLDGLSNLTQPISLEIHTNASLNNIEGLGNISALPYMLQIVFNPQLAMCDLDPICQRIFNDPAGIWIEGNDPGCNQFNPDCITGIDETANAFLEIYPNPTKDKVYFSDHYNGKYRVFDMLGNILLADNFSSTFLDLSSLDKGVFILELEVDSHILKTKVIRD